MTGWWRRGLDKPECLDPRRLGGAAGTPTSMRFVTMLLSSLTTVENNNLLDCVLLLLTRERQTETSLRSVLQLHALQDRGQDAAVCFR